MADADTGMIIGFVAIAIVGYAIILKNTQAVGTEAGKYVADKIIDPAIVRYDSNPVNVLMTGTQGLIEGRGAYALDPYIPGTPEGYTASNWNWKLQNGVTLGLPAGWTPQEFCRASPDSPICRKGAGVI